MPLHGRQEDTATERDAKVEQRLLLVDSARDTAAMLTACAFGPVGHFCFVAPCDCGLGLFARSQLAIGQFISEYDGPRLPRRLQAHGRYVLQIPGASTIIDGDCENSPFDCPRSPAIYANHSSQPNARLETWPVLRPGPHDIRQRVVLVASESIEAGREVRIDYDDGGESYWMGSPPIESGAWRELTVRPPPPTIEEPIINRLQELQTGAVQSPSRFEPLATINPIDWVGPAGGDDRLRAVVPLFSSNGRHVNSNTWALISTHLPGRSGTECRDRWLLLLDQESYPEWLHSAATASVTHSDAAAAMREKHLAAAAAALACVSDDDESQRCCICNCKNQLLECHGQKAAGSAVGCAESSHVLCAKCLERWFAAQNELRQKSSLPPLRRKLCPVCNCELRATQGDMRGNADRYALGLLKVHATWA